jgi:DNA-binding CsgD family transcriptional regulator
MGLILTQISNMHAKGVSEKNGFALPILKLTPRETEILQLIAHGLTNKQLEDELGISPDTAESHRSNIIKKLRAKNISNAVAIALRNGIIK